MENTARTTKSEGFHRGLAAHAEGLPAVPLADAWITARILPEVGANTAMLKGWTNGWHHANNMVDDTDGAVPVRYRACGCKASA